MTPNGNTKNGLYKSNEFLPKPQKIEKLTDRKSMQDRERSLNVSRLVFFKEYVTAQIDFSIKHLQKGLRITLLAVGALFSSNF